MTKNAERRVQLVARQTVYQCCLGQPDQRVHKLVRWVDGILRESGVPTAIFATDTTIDPAIKSLETLPRHDDYILVLHHSSPERADEIDAVAASSAPMVILHHSSFTPLRSLRRWVPWAVAALGCDPWATIELRSAGFTNPITLPRLYNQAIESSKPADDRPFTIVAPGDLARGSAALFVIDAFAKFREQWERPSQLILLGRTLDARMAKKIQERIRLYDLDTAVLITGAIDLATRNAYLADADVCVALDDPPSALDVLSQAVQSAVPILARPIPALEHALGPYGLPDILPSDGLPLAEKVAAALLEIANNPAQARTLAAARQAHERALQAVSPEAVLMMALGRCGLVLPAEQSANRLSLSKRALS